MRESEETARDLERRVLAAVGDPSDTIIGSGLSGLTSDRARALPSTPARPPSAWGGALLAPWGERLVLAQNLEPALGE